MNQSGKFGDCNLGVSHESGFLSSDTDSSSGPHLKQFLWSVGAHCPSYKAMSPQCTMGGICKSELCIQENAHTHLSKAVNKISRADLILRPMVSQLT